MSAEGVIGRNLEAVLRSIDEALAASGRTGPVTVMAVTKTHGPDVVREVLEAGIRTLGENRVSEAGRKMAALGRDAAEFHLIGPFHAREARRICRDFHSVDAVGRAEQIEALAARLGSGPVPPLLLEVNTTPGEAKHGFPADADLLCRVLERAAGMGLTIRGLMTVGPLRGGPDASLRSFALLRGLRDRICDMTGRSLPELSMGMSDDYPEAVREGSTTVRLGRALLGARALT